MNYHPRQIGNKTERYALIQEGERDIFIIGLNPSTADETKLDPTMRRTMQIAEFNGYDGFIMLNLYPQRSTKPKDLARNIDIDIHKRNLEIIEDLLKNNTSIDVWLAFGANICIRKYLLSCFKDIINILHKHNANLFYINKLTKAGFPPHPLYQKTNYLKPYHNHICL